MQKRGCFCAAEGGRGRGGPNAGPDLDARGPRRRQLPEGLAATGLRVHRASVGELGAALAASVPVVRLVTRGVDRDLLVGHAALQAPPAGPRAVPAVARTGAATGAPTRQDLAPGEGVPERTAQRNIAHTF